MTRMRREQSAGYLANHAARLFKAMMDRALAPLGLATAPFGILLVLWPAKGLTQKDLVERLNLEQATVANTLSRMERDGLIVRRADPRDRRRQLIHATARARKLERAATACARGVNARALAGLSATERAAFLTLLQRVIATQRRALGAEPRRKPAGKPSSDWHSRRSAAPCD